MTQKKSDERWNQILQKERFIGVSSDKKVPERRGKKAKARRRWGSEAFLL